MNTDTRKTNLKPVAGLDGGKTKKLTPLPKLLSKAQDVVNRYVRKRDEGKPCISCGSFNTSDAGHYFSRGHYTALRFSPENIHLQCVKCNCHLHGNLLNYRKGLIQRYGADFVGKLETSADLRKTHKWERLELEAIIQEYTKKYKELCIKK